MVFTDTTLKEDAVVASIVLRGTVSCINPPLSGNVIFSYLDVSILHALLLLA